MRMFCAMMIDADLMMRRRCFRGFAFYAPCRHYATDAAMTPLRAMPLASCH
jgi:hypothetical protein